MMPTAQCYPVYLAESVDKVVDLLSFCILSSLDPYLCTLSLSEHIDVFKDILRHCREDEQILLVIVVSVFNCK